MEADEERYLSEGQVAALLGISERTLQAWRYRGGHTPPFLKLGRTVRYRLGDVKQWLRERERRSTSDPGPDV
jgi:excisionase family DNA binding protein